MNTENCLHIMADIEAMSTAPTASITEIGWASFFPRGRGWVDSGLLRVDLQSCIDLGLTVDASTIHFWMQQEEALRLRQVDGSGVPLERALRELCGIAENMRPANWWANGIAYDQAVLDNAYRRLGLRAPWKYNQWRDLRTLGALLPVEKPPRPVHLPSHSAEADACAQVLWAQALFDFIPKGTDV